MNLQTNAEYLGLKRFQAQIRREVNKESIDSEDNMEIFLPSICADDCRG